MSSIGLRNLGLRRFRGIFPNRCPVVGFNCDYRTLTHAVLRVRSHMPGKCSSRGWMRVALGSRCDFRTVTNQSEQIAESPPLLALQQPLFMHTTGYGRMLPSMLQ